MELYSVVVSEGKFQRKRQSCRRVGSSASISLYNPNKMRGGKMFLFFKNIFKNFSGNEKRLDAEIDPAPSPCVAQLFDSYSRSNFIHRSRIFSMRLVTALCVLYPSSSAISACVYFRSLKSNMVSSTSSSSSRNLSILIFRWDRSPTTHSAGNHHRGKA